MRARLGRAEEVFTASSCLQMTRLMTLLAIALCCPATGQNAHVPPVQSSTVERGGGHNASEPSAQAPHRRLERARARHLPAASPPEPAACLRDLGGRRVSDLDAQEVERLMRCFARQSLVSLPESTIRWAPAATRCAAPYLYASARIFLRTLFSPTDLLWHTAET